MAEEATIQGVVNELIDVNKALWSTADLHLEVLSGIEGAVISIDSKIGRMLEQPAIQKSLQKMSDNIVQGITDAVDRINDANKFEALQQSRDEAGEVTPPAP